MRYDLTRHRRECWQHRRERFSRRIRDATRKNTSIDPERLVSVMKLSTLFALSSCLASAAPAWGRIWSGSASPRMEEAVNYQLEQLEAMRSFLGPMDGFTSSHAKRDSVVQFHNPKTREFLVDGTKIPLGLYSSARGLRNKYS